MAEFLFGAVGAIAPQLFSRLSALNSDFQVSTYLQNFEKLKTNLDRVNFVYKDLKKYNLFPKYTKIDKSDVKSKEFQELGNEAFGAGNYMKALEFYTGSITAAKSQGVLALAYANRSACLYRLERYQECLTDIERAVANNYPDKLKPKLINRRLKAEKLLTPVEPYHDEIPKIATSKKNPQIQCAKNCVEIKTNEEFGRHVVASREIQIGEVIVIEEPYSLFLTSGRSVHCNACLKLCYNLIPCENCCFLMFCSEDCRNRAQNVYHKFECPIFGNLVDHEIDAVHILALRIAILAKGNYQHLNSMDLDAQEMYRSDRYKEIHNLMPATDKRPVRDLFNLAVTASCMFHFLLNHSSFFNAPNSANIKQNFKEVLLLQLQIMSLNELRICEIVQGLFGDTQKKIAHGVYSFASLFNHSCCPNVEKIQYGSTMVLRTVNTIKKGQQCFISYGPKYEDGPRVARQRLLDQFFFFDCKCPACVKDWHPWDDLVPVEFPLHMDLDMDPLEVKFMLMELSCSNTHAAKRHLPRLIDRFKRCENFEPWGNSLEIKQYICKCYKIFGNKRMML